MTNYNLNKLLNTNTLFSASLISLGCVWLYAIYKGYLAPYLNNTYKEIKELEEENKAANQRYIELKEKIKELEKKSKAANQRYKPTEDQIRATDERNRATDERNRATDERIRAMDERNRATDEKIRAMDERNRATDEKIREMDERMKPLLKKEYTPTKIKEKIEKWKSNSETLWPQEKMDKYNLDILRELRKQPGGVLQALDEHPEWFSAKVRKTNIVVEKIRIRCALKEDKRKGKKITQELDTEGYSRN